MTTGTCSTNHRRQVLRNLTKYSVEIVKASLCIINVLKAELNSICHLLTLLGAHHIFHVSRIRVKQNTVETYYGVEVNLHAFFTTASDGDVPLNSKPDRSFPI